MLHALVTMTGQRQGQRGDASVRPAYMASTLTSSTPAIVELLQTAVRRQHFCGCEGRVEVRNTH